MSWEFDPTQFKMRYAGKQGPAQFNIMLDSDGDVFLVHKGATVSSEATLTQASSSGPVIYVGNLVNLL